MVFSNGVWRCTVAGNVHAGAGIQQPVLQRSVCGGNAHESARRGTFWLCQKRIQRL